MNQKITNFFPRFSLSDEDLMWRLQTEADSEAFDHLVQRWQDRLRQLCFRMTADSHTADDLTQETFARVFAKRHHFKQGCAFGTYLRRIAVNLWIPYLFGEGPKQQEDQLSAHLQGCEQCAAQLQEWQWTLSSLDRWKPPRAQHPAPRVRKIWHWAAAAALMIAAVGLARASIGGQLARHRAEVRESLQEMVAAAVQNAAPSLMAASAAQTERLLQNLLEFSAAARDEDQQAALALYRQLQQQQTADYLSLRKDLETVASLTDDEIRQAGRRIVQLSQQAEKPAPARF